MLEAGDLRLDPATRQVWRGDDEIALSAKEFSLLEAFMRRPGEVLSRYQLLEHAWDYDYENRSNVVDVYVRYLRQKIDRPFGTDTHRDGPRRGLPLPRQRLAVISRLSIRARLTVAFAAAMILVLALAGLFVYLRVEGHLSESLDESLQTRADDVAAAVATAPAGSLELGSQRFGDDEDAFSQVLATGGGPSGSTFGDGAVESSTLPPTAARS